MFGQSKSSVEEIFPIIFGTESVGINAIAEEPVSGNPKEEPRLSRILANRIAVAMALCMSAGAIVGA